MDTSLLGQYLVLRKYKLREIQDIRQRFTKFSSYENRIQSKDHQNQLPFFADTIMQKFLIKGSVTNMQYSRQNTKTRRWKLYGGIAVLLCACLLIISITAIHQIQNTQPPPQASGITGSPKFWDVRQDQMTLQNKDVVFAVKNIDFSYQEFQFFYAMKSSEPLQIHFTSSVNNTGEISLITHDQPLGKLGVYTIGVFHVQLIHRLNQVITISVTSQAHLTPLVLQPLKELFIDDHPNQTGSFGVDQNNFPDTTWYGPVVIQQVAFFKDTSNKNAGSDAPHIFVRLDTRSVVTIISKSEYLSFAGQENYF